LTEEGGREGGKGGRKGERGKCLPSLTVLVLKAQTKKLERAKERHILRLRKGRRDGGRGRTYLARVLVVVRKALAGREVLSEGAIAHSEMDRN